MATTCDYQPDYAVARARIAGRHALLHRRVRRRRRRRASAVSTFAAAPGAGAGESAGRTLGEGRFRIRAVRVQRDPAQRPRQGLSRPDTVFAGQLRLLGAAPRRPQQRFPRLHGLLRRFPHGLGGPALRNRPRRLGSRAGSRRRLGSRGPGNALQDLQQDVLPEARGDGDVHGQVVDGLPRPKRPLPLLAAGRRRRQRLRRRGRPRPRPLGPRRPSALHPAVPAHARAYREQLCPPAW